MDGWSVLVALEGGLILVCGVGGVVEHHVITRVGVVVVLDAPPQQDNEEMIIFLFFSPPYGFPLSGVLGSGGVGFLVFVGRGGFSFSCPWPLNTGPSWVLRWMWFSSWSWETW